MSINNNEEDLELQSLDSKELALIGQLRESLPNLQVPTINFDSAQGVLKDGVDTYLYNISQLIASGAEDLTPDTEVRFQNLYLDVDIKMDKKGNQRTPTVASAFVDSTTGCFRSKSKQNVQILKGISGIFRPSTLTLILGQPGSGKSALLKTLSNRFPYTSSMNKEGEIWYSGYTVKDLGDRLPRIVSYVDQVDNHYPALTVQETFQFAHECSDGNTLEPRVTDILSKPNDQNSAKVIETLRSLHQLVPEIVARILGLDHCKDTVVGDSMLRGVSGGEKKRVTTGELLFGKKRVLLLDEISTGLDSAATYDIVNSLKSVAKYLGATIVISLLQPPPEVYNLFDDVLLLDKGRIIYHGPREHVLPYFESLGYRCPPRKDVADFLIDIPTVKNVQFQTLELAPPKKVPITSEQFADCFKESQIYAKTLRDLASGFSPNTKENYRSYIDGFSNFRQTYLQGLVTLCQRQKTLLLRDKGFIVGRTMMVMITSLLYGSTFWDVNASNVQVVIGLLFSSLLFIALGAAPQIPNFVIARDIFYKQRGSNFFRTSNYTLSVILTQLPFTLVEAIVFGSLVYWMSSLVPTWYRFITYILILFLTNVCFLIYFLFLTSISPGIIVAQPLSMVSIFFCVIFAGFIITKDLIPNYWIWFYWISPLSWSVRSLTVNHYTDDRFQVCVDDGVDYCDLFGKTFGDYTLGLYGIEQDPAWIWYGVLFLLSFSVFFLALSTIILEHIRHHPPKAAKVENDLDVAVAAAAAAAAETTLTTTTSTSTTTSDSSDSSSSTTTTTTKKVENSNLNGIHSTAIDIVSNPITVPPVTLSFIDLWYSVRAPGERDGEIDLLKGVTGYAGPGKLTALMGSSGAGKTTLIDVISSRKTGGKIRGKILLNGYPATKISMKRCAGYCEQIDLHSEAATVREAITFSAFLRQSPEIPDAEKWRTVQDCLDLLQLNDIADIVIRGLSTEQMKRVTISVELAAMPSILFLDEPTSGLDAQAAKMIMQGVKNIARSGRTVVCTIHQPSTDVFSLFDNLLLLKRGGQTVFFGELGVNCDNLINYFQNIPGTAPIEAGYNPATWMLEVIGAGVGHEVTLDYAAQYQQSAIRSKTDAELQQMINVATKGKHASFNDNHSNVPVSQEILFKSKRATPTTTQIYMLGLRFSRLYWRSPNYNLTRFTVQIFFALVFGSIYYDSDFTSFQGVNSTVGMIFLSTFFLGMTSMMAGLPVYHQERSVYYRERASETYSAFSYYLVLALIEIPYVFSSTLIFTIIFFPFVGFTGVNRFFWYWYILSQHILLYVFFGQALSNALPDTAVASLFSALLNTIFSLFSGFNPPESSIPIGYKWIYYISPPAYSISALVATIFSDCSSEGGSDIGCQLLSDAPPSFNGTTVKSYVEDNFGMKIAKRDEYILILVAMTIALSLIGLVSLRYINHQKR